MTYFNATLAALALTLGLSGGAQARPASVGCEIDVLRTGQGVILRPVASASSGLAGIYQLSVDTAGRAGRSSVSQGGEFAVRGGQRTTLGSVALGQGSGAVATARMDLSWRGGRTSCVRKIRL